MSLPRTQRNIWIHNIAPPPGPVCVRIATNQIGEPGVLSEPLNDAPGSGTWTGDQTGASGTHQRYEYALDLGAGIGIYQQYIVMSVVTGNPFTAGEVLTPAGAA